MDANEVSDRSKRCEEVVVLLHGLISHQLAMAPMTKFVSKQGYRALNWGYFSFFDSIPNHATRLKGLLYDLDAEGDTRRIHFVTHSMGGLVVRAALADFQSEKLGRFVMLAPPNRGSQVARAFSYLAGPTWPSLRQMSDADGSFVNQLPQPQGVQVGVIAAVPDHVVRLESTRMDGLADHTTVKGPHRAVPFRQTTRKQVASFLASGEFLTDLP